MQYSLYFVDNRNYSVKEALRIIDEYRGEAFVEGTMWAYKAATATLGLGLVTYSMQHINNLTNPFLLGIGYLVTSLPLILHSLYSNNNVNYHHSYSTSEVSGAELVNALNHLNQLNIWSSNYYKEKEIIVKELFNHDYSSAHAPTKEDSGFFNPGVFLNATKAELSIHKGHNLQINAEDQVLIEDIGFAND